MTTLQLILMSVFYSALFVAIVYFSRATFRRILGAAVASLFISLIVMGIVILGEWQAWWQVGIGWNAREVFLLYLALSVSCAPVYLISWRLAGRFGWRGLGILAGLAAVVGPVRDYLVAAQHPDWIIFGSGFAPVAATAATYSIIVILGHFVMWVVAGPSQPGVRLGFPNV